MGDDLNPHEQLIAAAADRMLARGSDPKDVQEFVQRALRRLAQNEAERPLGRKELAMGMARGVAQGATFNFADELEGLARSMVKGDSYDDEVSRVRAEQNRFRQQEPGLAFASEMAGAVVPGIGAARFVTQGARGASALARAGSAVSGAEQASRLARAGSLAARIAASGGGSGALAGAGAAEGDVADRLPAAVVGGGLGAVTGYAAGKTANAVARRLAPRLPGLASPAEQTSLSRVIKAMDEAGVTPDQLSAMQPDAAEMRVVDVLGAPGRRAARRLRTLGGQPGALVDAALAERSAGQHGRIVDRLLQPFGPETAAATADDLIRRQAERAGPLYEEFRALGDLPMTDKLKETMRAPMVQEAIRAAKKGTRLHALPDNNAEVLDEAYKYLTDKEWAARRGFRVGQTKADFLAAIDDASGGRYSPAVQSFAGDAALLDALSEGRKAFLSSADPAEIAATMQRMSPSERELYQRGAIDALRQRLENVGDHRDLTKLLDNTGFRKRAQAIYGDAADGLLRSLAAEREMAATSDFVRGGSQTADKAADASDSFLDEVQAGLGGIGFSAKAALRRMAGTAAMAPLTRRVANSAGRKATADALLTPLGGSALDDLIKKIREHQAAQLAPQAARAIGGYAAGSAGAK